MCGTRTGVPGSAAPGNKVPAPRSSDVAGLGVSRLLLPSSLSFLTPPIDWRRVGDDVEFMYSQVTAAERLMHGEVDA
jgi:hypothetical protein